MRTILLLLLPLLLNSAIMENCLRYFTNIELQKSTCIECRDGFYIKAGTCLECNKIIKVAECSSLKTFNYGSNIIALNSTLPAPPKNSTLTPTPINLTQSELKAGNSSMFGQKSTPANNTNSGALSSLKRQISASALAQKKEKMNETRPDITSMSVNVGNSSSIPLNPINSSVSTQPFRLNTAQQRLENCKEVGTSGKCSKCFTGYQIKSELCVRKQKKDEDKMANCFVYSEIETQCIMCEEGYEINAEGYCKSTSAPQQATPNTNKNETQPEEQGNKTEFNYAKAEVLDALEGSAVKDPSADSQIQISPTNLLISAGSRSFKVSPSPESNGNNTGVTSSSWREQRQKRTEKPLITLENSNDSLIIKLGEEDGCLQYESPSLKTCRKCSQNYLLNPLLRKCININKPIELAKTSTSSNSSIGNRINRAFGENGTIPSKSMENSSVGKVKPQEAPTTTITIIVSNGNANSVINISATSAKPTIDNGITNIIINSDAQKDNSTIASLPMPTSTTGNSTTSTYMTMGNITSNSTNSTSPSRMTNSSANSTGSGAIILGGGGGNTMSNSSLGVSLNDYQQNKTTVGNAAGKTSSAPSCLNTVPKCIKCVETGNECSHCEVNYQLYLGKCYDTFSYRLIVKSKLYGQSV